MIISHQHRFIFIHVPRTGGEAVTAALAPELDPHDRVLRSGVEPKPGAGDPGPDGLGPHSTARAVAASLPLETWQGYLVFALVRHPVDRMVSWYRQLGEVAENRTRWNPGHARYYLTNRGRRVDPLRWGSMRAFRETDSFSAFLRHPLLQDAGEFRSQADHLTDGDGALLVDEVGHTETLAQDLRALASRIGIEPWPPPRANVSTWQPASGPVEATDADRDLLLDRFADDLRLFGYGPYAMSSGGEIAARRSAR